MTWRNELLDELKKRWLAGESASEISSALLSNFHVAFSRNAIMGKLYRLGITRPGQKPRAARIPPRRSVQPWAKSLPQTWPKSPPRKGSSLTAQFSQGSLCSLLELTNLTCRWPIGDPSTDDFRFCGIAEADLIGNRPYCKFHTQMSAGNDSRRN